MRCSAGEGNSRLLAHVPIAFLLACLGCAADAVPPVATLDGSASPVDDAAAADLATPPIAGFCTVDGWCWSNPLPQGNQLEATWSFAPDDVWACGQFGTLLHYDGHAWRPVPSGARVTLSGLWASGPRDLWAVGGGGTVLHYNGATWSTVASGTSAGLNAVWGSGPGDVWAVGETAIHWDGTGFTTIAPSFAANETLRAVWGSGPRDVLAVGTFYSGINGFHWDGATWSPAVIHAGSDTMEALWGFGSDDVWTGAISGDRGFDHWNGTTWQRLPNDLLDVTALWGPAPDDLWATGRGRNGTATQHFDGHSWSEAYRIFNSPERLAIHGSRADDAWSVGQAGCIDQWNGRQWRQHSDVAWIVDPRAIWASSASDVWVATWTGRLAHFDGARWSSDPRRGPFRQFNAFAGTGPNDVWAVGATFVWEGGHVQHWNGAAWQELDIGNQPGLNAAWAAAPDDAWAVGWSGLALHWDGRGWTPVPTGVTETLRSVWGTSSKDVTAVGESGAYLRWNGSAWRPQPGPGLGGYRGVWRIGDEEWVVGSGSVAHFDGAAWSREAISSGVWLDGEGISGVARNDVWVALGGTEVLHWDGATWRRQEVGTGVRAIRATTHDVWAAGWPASIVRLRR